jgi:hypothetical protein
LRPRTSRKIGEENSWWINPETDRGHVVGKSRRNKKECPGRRTTSPEENTASTEVCAAGVA